jgi:hypothetical protein
MLRGWKSVKVSAKDSHIGCRKSRLRLVAYQKWVNIHTYGPTGKWERTLLLDCDETTRLIAALSGVLKNASTWRPPQP